MNQGLWNDINKTTFMFFSPAYTFKRLHFLHSVINAEVCFCTSADCWFCFSGKANCWGAGWGALQSLHWSTSENPGQPRPSPQVSCPRPCWALINTEFSDERIRLLLGGPLMKLPVKWQKKGTSCPLHKYQQ